MACCGPICRLRTQAFLSGASCGVAARMNSLAGMILTSLAPRPALSVRSTMSRRNVQGVVELGVRREDDVRLAGGEVPALRGVAGLEQHRPVLGAARQPRRDVHGVVLPFMPHAADRAGAAQAAPRRGRDGAVVPGVPDPLGGLHERFGVDVAVGVVEVAAAAEVRAGPGVVRGDDVPGGAAAGDQVQRGQPVGQVRGIVVGGVLRGHQPDVGGHRGQRGQHGLRVRAGPATSRACGRPRCSRSRSPSPRKKAANSPRSAVWAMRRNDSKSVCEPDSADFQMVPELTPWKKTPRLSCPDGVKSRMPGRGCAHGFLLSFRAAVVAAGSRRVAAGRPGKAEQVPEGGVPLHRGQDAAAAQFRQHQAGQFLQLHVEHGRVQADAVGHCQQRPPAARSVRPRCRRSGRAGSPRTACASSRRAARRRSGRGSPGRRRARRSRAGPPAPSGCPGCRATSAASSSGVGAETRSGVDRAAGHLPPRPAARPAPAPEAGPAAGAE